MVNDEPVYYGEAPGRFVGMDIVEPMYLGGVPNYAEIPRAAGFSTGFVGTSLCRLLLSFSLHFNAGSLGGI